MREGEQRGKKQQQRFQRFVAEHTTDSTSTSTTVRYALVLLLQGRNCKTAEKTTTTTTTTVCPRRDDVHPGRLGRSPGNQKRTFQACDFLNFLEHLRHGQKERVGLDKQKPGLIRIVGKGSCDWPVMDGRKLPPIQPSGVMMGSSGPSMSRIADLTLSWMQLDMIRRCQVEDGRKRKKGSPKKGSFFILLCILSLFPHLFKICP